MIEDDIKANVGRRLKVKAVFTCGWMMRESEPARKVGTAEIKSNQQRKPAFPDALY